MPPYVEKGAYWRHAKRILRATVYCFNVNTLWLCLTACGSCFVADKLGLRYNLEFSLLALGITIPVTFNITQAFTRRERALMMIAEIKASVVALYWQHRDWAQDDHFPNSLGNDRHAWAIDFANTALEFLSQLQQFMQATGGYESLSEVRLEAKKQTTLSLLLADTRVQPDDESLTHSFIERVEQINSQMLGYEHLLAAYRCLSRMSVMNEYLTFKAKYLRGGEGGMSRSAQYLRYCVAQMEQLRMIKIYRTPFMLRYCCSVLIHLGALVLGPYFQHAAVCDVDMEFTRFWCPAPYLMACIYGIICSLLLNVQAASEMPFDMTGMDDVFLELTSEFDDILNLGPPERLSDSGTCFDVAQKATAAATVAVAAAAAGGGITAAQNTSNSQT